MKPSSIKFHRQSQTLELAYLSEIFILPAEYLRVFSPSAEVQGHGPNQQVLQHGKLNVQIKSLEAQGNYALKLIFNDSHDSGIFTWGYLHELGKNQLNNWTDYEERLREAGKRRDPAETVVRLL